MVSKKSIKNNVKVINRKEVKLDGKEDLVLLQCEASQSVPPAVKRIQSYHGKIY
jgi:hypothetical protein